MNKSLQIFKPGKHTTMSGVELSFTEADLKATAAAYDPAKHDAPIVVGHPKHDDPAYGWIGSLSFRERVGGEGAALEACPIQVDPAFADMVGRGAFKKISASFYSPDSPGNPVPGVYYLRHVGFLGAQPPAVKGLRQPEFAEGEAGVVEFNEWHDTDNASLWRGLREWIIGKFGQDEADKVVPAYTVKSLEQSAQDSLQKSQAVEPVAAFNEPQPQGDEMSDAEKSRLAALEIENEKLKKSIAEFVEAQARTKRDALHAEHTAFAEGLVKAGKLLPANKDVVVATLDLMAGQEAVVEFGEGDAKRPLLDAHKAMLLAQPKLVEFGELSGAEPEANAGVASFAAPRGYTVDPDKMATHNKAIVFAEKNKCDYITAVKAVA